ncbi:protein-export chaperone SecB [Aestuariirhabdus litorea]|uniref:Protein-export protein SecB n=1 Tax=Aestuariirhabdus litorea TaxID=2528527 RepID=A0A3P3VMJ3_9GAMM|nr:protein-export chaperone SecB [Aestuariirhabdus litorea]RRJ83108.1 protein-export chaperone SecB [Aestuariirhabdus litorea]RWW93265.1 protein-export chaperone SecB [Endozoicomonadaceae bacterium GTF-13]
MAEEQQNTAADNSKQPQFSLQRIYVKDISFESPKSPEMFRKEWRPKVNLDLNTRNSKLDEGVFEVVLALTVTVENGEETAFVAEVQQAGIFAALNLEESALHHTLGSFCPNILFPYAREAVDNLVTRGSFPPIMLAPVNFDALYAQAVAQKQAEQQQAAAE